VKDYVDLLSGPVVCDDKRVDHLLILRGPPAEHAEVTIRCLPLSIAAAEYDRAFWIMGESGAIATVAPDLELNQAPFRDGAPNPDLPPWGLTPFDQYHREILRYERDVLGVIADLDAQEAEQLEEDPEAPIDLDILPTYDEFDDPQVRDSVRSSLEESVGLGLATWLTDQGFDARDRPGGYPSWLAEAVDRDEADVLQLADEGPGCFVLPAPVGHATPPGERSWSERVEHECSSRLRSPRWARTRFGGPLILDIALRGRAAQDSDVDNVAHEVLHAFIKVLHGKNPEFLGYRIYRQAWHEDDVRVRLMPATRLQALANAMDKARDAARGQAPRVTG
jgi:hypothetical protein